MEKGKIKIYWEQKGKERLKKIKENKRRKIQYVA